MLKRGMAIWLAVLLCLSAGGCAARAPEEGTGSGAVPSAGQQEETAAPGGGTEEAPASGTPEEAASPVSIETPAGVILVGTIRKDAAGWYFEPEQPLDVTFTYFTEPLYFTGVTRLTMYDADVDGTDKTPYLDELVTATGMLTLPRGEETLSFIPEKIEWGKTAEGSQAADVQPSAGSGQEYDPSQPLPPAMEVTVEDGHYVYNPYRLSAETLQWMGNGFADFYVRFVDAYLHYETSCACPDQFYADFLSSVLYYEFPLFAADGEMDTFTCYQDGVITWSYTANEEEHEELIRGFLAAAGSFLADVRPEQSDVVKAETLYHALCTQMTYDDEGQTTRVHIEPYYAYTRHSGVCVTFAGAYAQLLTQVGIECTFASATMGNGEGHVWNLVNLDGWNYFCDPTYELSWNGGSAFVYFGQSLADRLQTDPDLRAENIFIGRYVTEPVTEVELAEQNLPVVPLA